ncbi:hypothetical protein EDB86DRAFT_2938332 [Lactarius hatsudake]|nr:hypothetical protein EDB86DRAFT_2938332 [Lactarius hatsudake]
MNPPTFPFTDEELDAAGLRGEGVSESVVQVMKTMTEYPELLGDLSLFTLECMNYSGHRKSPSPPASRTLSAASSYLSALPVASDATAVAPYVLSDWERTTYYNVFNTPLNAVWGTVAPQICEFLKARNICYSAVKAARFVTHGEDGKDTRGPVVIWIATHPTTTTAKNAHDASPDILALLKANGVENAVVEWYEGAIKKL